MRKREAIVAAAVRAFLEHGLSGASIEAIAADAGVSKVTVYNHFGDKEGLFAAAVESQCAKMRHILLFDDGQGPLRERLVAFGRSMVAFLSRPELIRFERRLAAETEHRPELGERFLETGPRRILRALADVIARARDRGELEVEDPAQAADQLCGMCKGFGDLERRFAIGPDAEQMRRRVEAAVDLFMRGYRPRSGPG